MDHRVKSLQEPRRHQNGHPSRGKKQVAVLVHWVLPVLYAPLAKARDRDRPES